MPPFPLARVATPFRAMARAFVPELAAAGLETWRRVEETIGLALAGRPRRLVCQLVWFVRAVDWMTRIRTGKSLARARPEELASLLHRLERGGSLRLRRGVFGLRTLVFMGYYGDPSVGAGLGYRASAAGWDGVR